MSEGAATVLLVVVLAIVAAALALGGSPHHAACPAGTARAIDGFCTHVYAARKP